MSGPIVFAALECDEAVRRQSLLLQEELRRRTEGSYPRAENFHVTLFYFGRMKAAHLGMVRDIFSKQPLPCCALTFSLLARFEGSKGDTILYQAEPQEELSACHSQLSAEFAKARIPFDAKSFVPHVTLVRAKMKNVPISDIMVPKLVMRVDHAVLFESIQDRGRQIYRPIWPLKDTD